MILNKDKCQFFIRMLFTIVYSLSVKLGVQCRESLLSSKREETPGHLSTVLCLL